MKSKLCVPKVTLNRYAEKNMKIINSDKYEDMAAAYQCLQIQTLYQTLKANGLTPDLIRKICEDFTFSFGVQNDQCWVESDNGKVFPTVGFTNKQYDQEPDELYLSNGMFSFAEYAYGDISWFFEEHNPDDEPQKYGSSDKQGNPA